MKVSIKPNNSNSPVDTITEKTPDIPISPITTTGSGPNKALTTKTLIVICLTIVLAGVATATAIKLFQNKQTGVTPNAPESKPLACVEECPSDDGILRDCHPPAANGDPAEKICDSQGKVEICGGLNFCCPGPSGSWTTDLSACTSPTPTATPSATPTITPTPTTSGSITPSPATTPTSSANLSPSPTTPPSELPSTQTSGMPTNQLPETGVGLPTVFGILLGVFTIIVSVALLI